MAHHRIKNHTGFTLIELVVVIVIIGILSVLGGQFIVAPIQGYVDLSRRAKLVDQAELALRRMQRDIRAALPNSIDPLSVTSIRMINTVDGGRYRRYVDPDADCGTDPDAAGCDFLDFTESDDSFDVLGGLARIPQAGEYLVVYNVTASGSTGNAYASPADNRATIAGTSTANRIYLSPGFPFSNASPYQRFFIVDEITRYFCDLNNRVLIRRSEPLSGEEPTEAIVTRGIEECEFTYSAGTTQRAGLVTLKLTLNEAGEEVSLLHQVHVVNAP